MKTKAAAFVVASLIYILPNASHATAFVGSGTIDNPDVNGAGIIPDSPSQGPAEYGNPLTISFGVNGLTSNIQNIAVSITMTHQWVGDLKVYLTSPDGTNFTIFSRVGPDQWDSGSDSSWGFGSANILGGSYLFDDYSTDSLSSAGYRFISQGTFNWGNSATWTNIIPGGIYRPTSEGPAPDPAQGIPNTIETNTTFSSNSGFVGLTPTHANGTWKLTFLDGAQTSTGTVSSATLYVNALATPRITGIKATNGILDLGLSGPFSHAFSLQRTTNLTQPYTSWEFIGGGIFDSNGTAIFESTMTGAGYFYRLSVP